LVREKVTLQLESSISSPQEKRHIAGGQAFLVHGLMAHRLLMWPLQRRLNAQGFQAINWGYRSTTQSCTYHAVRLVERIKQQECEAAELPIHFVGHSMGCIVIRAALDMYQPRSLGRVVMLAPPNGGSFVASMLGQSVKWFCRTIGELSEVPGSFVNQLAKPDGYEFGIIAAKHDWVIRPSNVELPGAADYSVVPCNHGFLPLHRQTLGETVRFLKAGSFKPL
jgi:pimeloyl-ACP methyl ester carboxylesterase